MITFTDIGTMLISAKSTFQSVHGLLPAAESMTGVFFIVQGLFRAYRLGGDPNRGHSITPEQIAGSLIFGGIMLMSGMDSIFASDITGGALGYFPPAPNPFVRDVTNALITMINAFGAIAIFRAILLFKKAADGDHSGGGDPVWKGFWHLVGGAAAFNLSPI